MCFRNINTQCLRKASVVISNSDRVHWCRVIVQFIDAVHHSLTHKSVTPVMDVCAVRTLITTLVIRRDDTFCETRHRLEVPRLC